MSVQREAQEENQLIAQRRRKLQEIRASAGVAFPNDARPRHLAGELHERFAKVTEEALLQAAGEVSLAGRMMAKRVMGKASFAQIQDGSGARIQLYLARDDLPQGRYRDFKTWDVGDIVYAEGKLFRTRTGELTVKGNDIRLLTKSLRPLPEKFHGLSDRETRYRRRYLDLIVNRESRAVFVTRSKVIGQIRHFFAARDFLEVETPMMQAIPGGAAAKPFTTFHNALHMPLFLRIAPELYLKRLVVGGFDRVFEINRNFRNEGVSTRHNPEFTMLEFYQAYATYEDLMTLSETLCKSLAAEVLGRTKLSYQGIELDFAAPFARFSLREAILHHVPESRAVIDDAQGMRRLLQTLYQVEREEEDLGVLQVAVFEAGVEEKLLQPTFITDYPAVVSPLSRRKDADPQLAERFELFIGGWEIANGFSELNDPEDQAARFRAQAAALDSGDEEAMHYDGDYIRALEYGMPPTAGEGIGIDRLLMLLTDSASIRDVVLFPHMRPE